MGPLLCTGEDCRGGCWETAWEQACSPRTHLESPRGVVGGFAPHFPETIQTGSELGSLPTSGTVGGLHSPGGGDGLWGRGTCRVTQRAGGPVPGTPTSVKDFKPPPEATAH